MKDISHNLELATPMFLYFIKNINKELAKCIQYRGVELDNDNIIFNFKSSQNTLSFKVYGGINVNNAYECLKSKTNHIYNYFKILKDESIS